MTFELLVPLLGLLALSRVAPGPLRGDEDTARLSAPVAWVEAPGLSELLAQGPAHALVARLLATPLGEAAGGAAALEALFAPLAPALGDAPRAALAAACAQGARLCVLGGDEPRAALLLRSGDAQRTAADLARALAFAGERAGFPRAFERPHDRVLGAEVWRVGDALVAARRDDLVVLAQGMEAARAALEGPDGAQLDVRLPAAGPRELLRGWIDLERARAVPRFRDGLGRLAELRAKPPVQLLLGSDVADLGGARSLAFSLAADGERLALALRAEGAVGSEAARARRDSPAPPVPAAHRDDVARAVVHRDLAGVLGRRAELFPPEVLPELSQPLAQLAVLFGGRDPAEAVLPGVSPWVSLVARDVPFAPRAVPEIPLPALAGVFRLEDAERLGPELVAAFQTLVAIGNVDRAQQGRDAMLLSVEREGDVSVTRAAFLAPRPGDGVDVRYNLEPACAVVGDALVLGTHAALVRDLVRELQAGAPVPAGGRERLEASGPALARVARQNRAALVAKAVLEEGKTRAEAEADQDGLRALLLLVERARLEVERAGDDVELSLALDLAGVVTAAGAPR